MDIIDIAIAATLGGATFAAIAGGAHMFIQGERYKRRCRRLDDLIHNAKMREADARAKSDAFQFNADTPALMCGGCGQSVPTTDGFSIADHNCPFAEQPPLPFEAGKKIPIGYTGHLHPLK